MSTREDAFLEIDRGTSVLFSRYSGVGASRSTTSALANLPRVLQCQDTFFVANGQCSVSDLAKTR